MNKKITALSLAAVLSVMSLGVTAFADDAISVFVNGSELDCSEVAPFIKNDCTLVPMRAIFEALGADVMWDGEKRTVLSYDPVSDVSVSLQIGSNIMYVGETAIELEAPAEIVNDFTVVPVRAISEGMNSVVDWDGDTRTVTVTKDVTVDTESDVSADAENVTAADAE